MPPDIEMNVLTSKEDSLAQGSSWSTQEQSYRAQSQRRGPAAPLRRWVEGFRRDPNRRVMPKEVINNFGDGDRMATGGLDGMEGFVDSPTRQNRYFDLHAANVGTANTMLARELKGRHLQMIAIGGSIGGPPLSFLLPLDCLGYLPLT